MEPKNLYGLDHLWKERPELNFVDISHNVMREKWVSNFSMAFVGVSYQVVQLRIGRKYGFLWSNLKHKSSHLKQIQKPQNLLMSDLSSRPSPTCLAKAAMSSLKESEEQTSLWLVMPGRWAVAESEEESRGEQVASSHFSNTKASSGNSGWLPTHMHTQRHTYTVNTLYINTVTVDIVYTRYIYRMCYMKLYSTVFMKQTAVNTSDGFSCSAW